MYYNYTHIYNITYDHIFSRCAILSFNVMEQLKDIFWKKYSFKIDCRWPPKTANHKTVTKNKYKHLYK